MYFFKPRKLREYKKLKKSATRLRQEFLRERAETAKTPKARKEISQIIKREEIRRVWRVVNSGRGKQRLRGISAVEVLQEDNIWTKIDSQHDVEQAIMANNSKRFHLASSTPLMQPEATQHIGHASLMLLWDLNKTFDTIGHKKLTK